MRALMADAFGDEFTDDDWDHALGGLHVLAERDGRLLGHAAVVQRHLTVGDRPYRVGYVEAVAVAGHARRQGIGAAVMGAAEHVIDTSYDFGALAATDDGIALYVSRGWRLWMGPIGVLRVDGVVATPDAQGCVMVRTHDRSPHLDTDATARLLAGVRRGDPW